MNEKEKETNPVVTVEQAWDIIKKDAIKKIEDNSEVEGFPGALGLNPDFMDTDEKRMDELVENLNEIHKKSQEVKALLDASKDFQEFTFFCHAVFVQQGAHLQKQKEMLGVLKTLLSK